MNKEAGEQPFAIAIAYHENSREKERERERKGEVRRVVELRTQTLRLMQKAESQRYIQRGKAD